MPRSCLKSRVAAEENSLSIAGTDYLALCFVHLIADEGCDMAEEKIHNSISQEPVRLGEHRRGLASEYAHEQGWGLNEEERTKLPDEKQDYQGGTDYEYGAQDFGDTAVDTSKAKPSPELAEKVKDSHKKSA